MQALNIEYWVELLFRRREIFSRVAVAVFGLIFVASVLWPPIYQSTSKILVQVNRAQFLVSPGLQDNLNQGAVVASPVSEQELNSEIELLTSRELIEQALADLPLPGRQSPSAASLIRPLGMVMSLPAAGYHTLHDTPRITEREQWALRLAQALSSSVIKRSNVIEVAFSAHDPEWCQRFLSRLLNQYLEVHARISHDPQAERFFQQQAGLLQQRLQHSEDALRTVQLQTGITSLNEQKQSLINELGSFETDYNKQTAELAATVNQIASLREQLKSIDERVPKESKVVQNFALQQIKPQVMQLEAERAELLSRYQPTSERIKEVDAKLAAARKILNRENHTEVQESSTDINQVWVTLESELHQATAQRAALEAGSAKLADNIQNYRARLRSLATDGLEVDRAQRQVDADKEAYLSYLRKSEEARAAGALNQSKILNVSVAEPPTTPLRPVFPKLQVNLAVGALLALLLAFGAAYWEESRDPKIYSAATIVEAAELVTLAVLRENF